MNPDVDRDGRFDAQDILRAITIVDSAMNFRPIAAEGEGQEAVAVLAEDGTANQPVSDELLAAIANDLAAVAKRRSAAVSGL